MGGLSKPKSTAWVVDIDSELAAACKEAVRASRSTMAAFTQAALANQLRNHRPVMEYVAEGKKKSNRSMASSLNEKLDRPDGVPRIFSATWPEQGWSDFWALTNALDVQNEIDALRKACDREPLSGPEWQAIVQEMGHEPGWRKNLAVEVESD